MKKLYKKGKVHPSPPPSSATGGGDNHHYLLDLQLPATILTLAATLSPQDKQVLAYLISCCGNTTTTTRHRTCSDGQGGGGGDHSPVFECNCFGCYMSFWARWDASPNRQLIHEIIEVYEEQLVFEEKNKSVTSKKKKKRSGKRACDHHDHRQHHESTHELIELEESSQLEVGGHVDCDIDQHRQDGDDHEVVEQEKGSMRKMVNFLGEKIWYLLN